MPKLKTRKSLQKRFKITKSGGVLRRATGQDHFRTKKTGKARRIGRKWVVMPTAEAKKILRALHL